MGAGRDGDCNDRMGMSMSTESEREGRVLRTDIIQFLERALFGFWDEEEYHYEGKDV